MKLMSNFKRSPRLAKGALVTFNSPRLSPQVIIFQYNPDSLIRNFETQIGKDKGNSLKNHRRKSQPHETISLDVEFDAANHLETSKNKAPNKGISLQLSLLKSMLCPANAKKNS